MLYNLDWLQKGQAFPPRAEIARIRKYSDNTLLFQGDIAPGFVNKEEYVKARARIERVLNNYSDMVCYPVDLNYHRLTSIKTADFVCGEKPIISLKGTEDSSGVNDMLNDDNIGFFKKLYTAVIDLSRFGDGVLRVYKRKDNGKNTVVVIDPRRWYKVVDEEDPTEVLCHVIAWVKEKPVTTAVSEYELHAQIHERGRYIKRVFSLAAGAPMDYTDPFTGQVFQRVTTHQIGNQIGPDTVVPTGLSDFAIVPLTGLITSDDIYGKDDYEPMDGILAEVWTRLGQIAIILDKHSNPDMHAPESAFMQNAKGEWVLKTGGNCYITAPDETVPGYITWDGQLTANFAKIDLLMKQLYRISEMGAVFEASESASNIAVETMKARFISALKKAERITNGIDGSVRKLIALISETGWKRVEANALNIEWCDGLPQDEGTEIDNATKLINAGLSTARRENVERFGKTQEAADEIQAEVDEQRLAAAAAMGFGHGGEGDDGGGVGDE